MHNIGRRSIAVTSIGDKWDGKQIRDSRDKFSLVRASLQTKASKGTRSTCRRARQILQRLSGRERRYQTWLNHNISKLIVLSALQNNAVIAIEDLTGIRKRTNTQPRNKTERRRSNSWAFFQKHATTATALRVNHSQQSYTNWQAEKSAVTLPQYQQFCPDVAIVNWYGKGAKLGMHQDKSESQTVRNAGSPIISISLGDTCLFRFGNTSSRTGQYQDIELKSGDLFVFDRRKSNGISQRNESLSRDSTVWSGDERR